jgi:hypothetical protein
MSNPTLAGVAKVEPQMWANLFKMIYQNLIHHLQETLELLNHLYDIWFNSGYEPGSNLYQRLESERLNTVCAADCEGWDSLKPEYENEVHKACKLLEKAHSLSMLAGNLERPYTEQLQVGVCSVIHILQFHIQAYEEMIHKMDLCVESYFEALREGTLDWQLALAGD